MAFSRVRKFSREYMAEEVDSSGNLNPKLLAIATEGYRIQSQYLGILDSWGYFSRGSPRLQVHQAAGFMASATLMAFFLLPCEGPIFVLALGKDIHMLRKLAAFAILNGWFVGLVWLTELSSRRRVAGFRWRDWKPRQD